MKLKRSVDDFQVEELVSLAAGRGPFSLYRLQKQSLGTLEAIDAIVRRWKLSREQVAFAGLKDRHAVTTQFLTIHGGPRRGWAETNLSVEYLGQAERPLHARDITANRFTIVVRDLDCGEADRAAALLAAAGRDGLPNYFDSQRFGSLGESGEFIARPWCRGDFERALWLALAEANVHDGPQQREQKRLLREHWGDWAACRAPFASTSDEARVLAHLANQPRDFPRALALLRQDRRSLWLAAFQSHLWNQILAAAIQKICRPEQLTRQTIGRCELPLFGTLESSQRAELAQLTLPLPSARLHLAGQPLQVLYDNVLAGEGLALREIRVKYPRDSFFSKGDRRAIFQPAELQHERAGDELYPARYKLTLRFTLPRGAYATILVKQLTGSSEELSED